MLSFDEARARLLSFARVLGGERVRLAAAAGRVLSRGVVADRDLPPFDYSAMDGYAVKASDVASAGVSLRVVGESRTGHVAPALTAGTACRIFTGAAVPVGADAVVMQEVVTREGDVARFNEAARPSANIRKAGEDVRCGAQVVAPGARLTAAHLGLLSMLDVPEVTVARRPRVSILATGDELRPSASAARAASIPESNSAALAALCEAASATVRVCPLVGDEREATERAIDEALDGCDVLLTVGGVSVGDHDVVRPALERAGVTLDFWKVAMKPGKPLAVGRSGRVFVLGLPGNPASAFVTFALFGMPLLRALQGDQRPLPAVLPARAGAPWKRSPGRAEMLRASLSIEGDGLVATPLGNQASGAMTALAACDGLMIVPEASGPLSPGDRVGFVRLGDL